jgi:hypothetical protein
MKKPAILPDHMVLETIKDMPLGGVGYCVPWAVYANEKKELFLNARYSYKTDEFGNHAMRIYRVKEGFKVDFPETYSDDIQGDYIGGADPIPVIEFNLIKD